MSPVRPTRPALRYHGGKWRLAPWIISFMPAHRIYVEPFGGAASVLMRKSRCYAEIYNELSGSIVNVFRVLRDPALAPRLREQLELTPFARIEFEGSYVDCPENPVEWARRVVIRSYMGFGSNSVHGLKPGGMRTRASSHRAPPTGFRCSSFRSGSTPASDWGTFPLQITAFTDRLRGVVIEQRPALSVLHSHDRADTLHYVDPPYPHSTRNMRRSSGRYTHELADDEHRELAATLRGLVGMVLLSGYPCELYDRELYADWRRFERPHLADGAKARTEVVWLNPACAAALERERGLPQFSLEISAEGVA